MGDGQQGDPPAERNGKPSLPGRRECTICVINQCLHARLPGLACGAVPLGGLVGDNIFLVPERVSRLAGRLRKWVALRRTPPSERRLAILL